MQHVYDVMIRQGSLSSKHPDVYYIDVALAYMQGK